jgi:hypothetical protein
LEKERGFLCFILFYELLNIYLSIVLRHFWRKSEDFFVSFYFMNY